MKNKVLLIIPNHFYYTDYQWIPTNMLFLAAVLLIRGYSPIIIDDRILSREQTQQKILKTSNETVLVLVSTASGRQLYNARRIAAFIKHHWPSVPIVFGGSHPSALPELTMCDCNIDYIVVGRGEYAAADLCDWVLGRSRKNIEDIPSVFFRNPNGVIRCSTIKKIKPFVMNDLPELPYFNKNVFDINWYLNPATRAVNYNVSTGCVGQCSFCYWPANYQYSFFENNRVIQDLMNFKEYCGMQNLTFDDPTFFVGKARHLDLAKLMIANNLNITWRANGRIDILKHYTLEQWKIFKASGCHLIHIGLESGSKRIIQLMNKNINIDDVIAILRLSSEAGIQCRFHILLGIPTETIEDLMLTAEMLKRMQGIFPSFDYTIQFFTPFPGNKLSKLAEGYGYSPPQSLEEYEQLNMFSYRNLPNDDRTIVKETSPWKEDYYLPWFNESFNKEYMRVFREAIPEKNEIVSVDGQKYAIFE